MEEFDFLYEFARKLVIKLHSNEEKAIGSQWLKFLKSSTNELRNNYLKVFIMCVQNQKLNGIFARPPPEDLSKLNEPKQLDELGKKHLLENYNEVVEDEPVETTLSSDKREYAAVQAIPNLGVQLYYATSETPFQFEDKESEVNSQSYNAHKRSRLPKPKAKICPHTDPHIRTR